MLQNFPIEFQFKFNGIKTKPVAKCERAFFGIFIPLASRFGITLFCCDSFFARLELFFRANTQQRHETGRGSKKHKQTPEELKMINLQCGRFLWSTKFPSPSDFFLLLLPPNPQGVN
jgi:hypothetical protein